MKVEGVQFHPESILTKAGKQLLGKFLALCYDYGCRSSASMLERDGVHQNRKTIGVSVFCIAG